MVVAIRKRHGGSYRMKKNLKNKRRDFYFYFFNSIDNQT